MKGNKYGRLFKMKLPKEKFLELDVEMITSIDAKNYERLRQFALNQIDKEVKEYKNNGKSRIDQIIDRLIRFLVFIEYNRGLKEYNDNNDKGGETDG